MTVVLYVVLYVVLVGCAVVWLLTPTGQRPEVEACGRSSVGERRVANAKVVGSTPAARLSLLWMLSWLLRRA